MAMKKVCYTGRSVFLSSSTIHVVCWTAEKKPTTKGIGFFTTPSIFDNNGKQKILC